MTTTSPDLLAQQTKALHEYSACDVSDALLKLQKPVPGQIARGGYLADIIPFAPFSPFSATPTKPLLKTIAPASTLKLISKSTPALDPLMQKFAIPKDAHWVDLTPPNTIIVIDQPPEQTCAAIGGIMANRMKVNGVLACVVSGRVRDLAELRESRMPVFALGRSSVGTGAEARVLGRECPIRVQGVDVNPGDIIFCDPLEGVVVIPAPLLSDVLALMPSLVAADDKVKEDVLNGSTVFDAFKKHRS